MPRYAYRVLPGGRRVVDLRGRDQAPAPAPELELQTAFEDIDTDAPAADILAAVGTDPDRARYALDFELRKARPRKGLRMSLEEIIG
jgi:hypothetical protein